MKHLGNAENCQVCEESTRPLCIYCGHALTGEIDEHGRTACENCGKLVWLGVGEYND